MEKDICGLREPPEEFSYMIHRARDRRVLKLRSLCRLRDSLEVSGPVDSPTYCVEFEYSLFARTGLEPSPLAVLGMKCTSPNI